MKNNDLIKVKKTNKNTNKNTNNVVEYTNKDIFYNQLKILNHNLDLVRNSVFNVIMTNNYVNVIEFEFGDEFKQLDKHVKEINNEISALLAKLNIKFNKEKS